MKQNTSAVLGLIAALSLGLGGCASTPAEGARETTVERRNLVTLTATVTAIDQESRVVTLRGPQGDSVTFKADESVRNLSQVRVGDEVSVQYEESLVMHVLKPEEAAVNDASAVVGRAKPGEMPAAVGSRQVTVTVTVKGIDKGRGTVTFELPSGVTRTSRAAEPSNLNKIKVGDRVVVTYTEAVAISVERLKK